VRGEREREQLRMIEAAGLRVQDRASFGTEMLRTERAPKLICVNPPPFLAPGPETAVFVNGEQLPSREEL
jgi:hypothetical protein